MTATEFKQKYPQYSHLEGDELWNKMEDSLFEMGEVLYADPNQVKTFHKPCKMDILQDDGVYREMTFTIEDSSTTKWLNKKGELVRVGDPERPKPTQPTESYSFQIIDFSDENRLGT